MTRREFRAEVDAPRPTAAWWMSLVASASLWLTEQLPFWVVGVQLVTYAVSYGTRDDPPAFRKSPVWLNVFMCGITTVTIRSALDGNPATISLAYFTSLAQGLQLLDARPRKSEFVLVALSLFQVVLASNLTDSVFFPPLLVVFLVTVTWTLLVHTLAIEAAEAGDPAAASRVITRDLRRTTILATIASLVLAGVLFVTLPRLKGNLMRGGSGPGIALSGFSDRVSLGTVGRIRKDQSVVLRVQGATEDAPLPPPDQAYWRGLAFDAFDGRDWSISQEERVANRRPVPGVGRFGIVLDPDGYETAERLVAQRILREPVEAGVLFTPGDALRIEGPFQGLERDRNDGLYLPGRGDERIRYTIWSRPSERDAVRLRADVASPPLEPRPGGPRPAMRYLALPSIDDRIHARAAELVAGQATDFERALALRDALRRDGRYTDAPPPLGDDDASPIEAFLLGELEGHCEYFASAMVVLARSAGLPARLVNGFAGGLPNEVGGFVEVSRADAHAWVEIHFVDAGWVRFDPTPPDLRLRASDDPSLWLRMAQLGSAIELWWFQRVVDFDSADQIGALRGLWQRWRRDRNREDAPSDGPRETPSISNPFEGLDPVFVFAGIVLLAGLASFWRRPRSDDGPTIPEAYRKALALLARAGLPRAETTPARAFASEVSTRLSPEGASAFDRITADYLAERFGAQPAGDLAEALASLEHAIDRMRLGDQAHVLEDGLGARETGQQSVRPGHGVDAAGGRDRLEDERNLG
ncbi:MAG: DUF3488 and transglutaminase-like domain-containing protein [bacterium]|nr:DUF3488 and transglutaminase-like domain-containing protein [bacterium]